MKRLNPEHPLKIKLKELKITGLWPFTWTLTSKWSST